MGSVREPPSDFSQLKRTLIQSGKLFEDPEFPADDSSIGNVASTRILWKRPKELTKSAKFIIQGATRFDFNQGDLGNCWFIAASACLATSHKQLFEWCVPMDQSFDKDYAGVFHFKFWRFGKWVDVVVDDRLPCKEVNSAGGKGLELLYARNNEQPDEFWVTLFEKAYAKANGSYGNLDGGLINDALVDFTGGISERIDLSTKRRDPGDLFEQLTSMRQMASFIGTHIITPNGRVNEFPNGLYSGHAYSVTKVIQLKGTSNRLLRLRNPWGKGEWNGRWSDGSKDWSTVPEDVKREIELEKREDGEFWISFEDWLKNFNRVAFCHLSPDAITKEISESRGKRMWNEESYKSVWVRGATAQGSFGFSNSRKFWNNPQFPVTLKPSSRGKTDVCHIVVSLMKRSLNLRLDIGFAVCQVKEGVPPHSLGQNYEADDIADTQMVPCQPYREISTHYNLKAGKYVVIPFTQFSNTEGEFLLRIFTEM